VTGCFSLSLVPAVFALKSGLLPDTLRPLLMKFSCPQCGQPLETQTMYKGQAVVCPKCGTSMVIPASGQGQGRDGATPPSAAVNGMTTEKGREAALKGLSALPQEEAGGTSISNVLTSEAAKKYEVGEMIAKGGMGAILNAKDVNLRRSVAMKVILDPRNASKNQMLRFVEEAQITGQLEHPGIVPLHELGMDAGGNIFYTMKFVKGRTLSDILKNIAEADSQTIRDYPLAYLLTIFQKVCDAIAFAHSRQVIHRDLKPENIMVGDYGEVVVMDWGLAKVLTKKAKRQPGFVPPGTTPRRTVDSGPSPAGIDSVRKDSGTEVLKTMDGQIMGTPGFMSPEQALGQTDDIDERTDIYALGAILYNILTLRVPVTGRSLGEILEKVSTGDIPHPSEYNPTTQIRHRRIDIDNIGYSKSNVPKTRFIDLTHLPGEKVPESLSAVTMKALSVDAARRYQTVKELQKEIEAYQGGFATTAEEAGALKQLSLLISRHKGVTFAVAASLVIIVLLSAAFTARVIKERNAATRALLELRKTAPTFAAQAKALVEAQDFSKAIEKIEFAINLDGANPDYHMFRANTLQAVARLQDAAAEYGRVLELRSGDTAARTNLELCQKLLAENAGRPELAAPLKTKLLNSILAQKRQADAVPLSRELKRDTDTAETTITSQLKAIMALPGWNANRLGREADGTFKLDLSELKVTDVAFLAGLPISFLDLSHCPVIDLQPLHQLPVLRSLHLSHTSTTNLAALRGLKLEGLGINTTKVKDLSPLEGMPITSMDAAASGINDLRPLRESRLELLVISDTWVKSLDGLQKLPLRELVIYNTPVEDLSPLRGSPVKTLWLNGCNHIRDFTPLLDCPRLETLTLPTHNSDVACLKKHPTLKRLSQQGIGVLGQER